MHIISKMTMNPYVVTVPQLGDTGQLAFQQLPSMRADFSFTLNILSHSTSGNCDFIGACETFSPSFCLRGPRTSRSTNLNDCPLGRNTALFPHTQQTGSRTISSSSPWPVSRIQCNAKYHHGSHRHRCCVLQSVCSS